jgi:hypothetical protein
MYNETEYLRSLPLSDRIVVLREKALRLQAENDALDAAANPPCPDHEDQRLLPDLFECPKCLDSASEVQIVAEMVPGKPIVEQRVDVAPSTPLNVTGSATAS